MQVLLRRFHSNTYYDQAKNWTSERDGALDFKEEAKAVETAKELQFDDLELVVVQHGGKFVFGKRMANDAVQNSEVGVHG